MRLSVAVVPVQQLILSLALALLTGLVAVYVATRFFRSRILLSGRTLSLGLVWNTLRGA